MRTQDFQKLDHFHSGEAWGDIDKLNYRMLWLLDCARAFVKRPFHISCGTEGKHKSEFHSLGLAVDFIVELKGRNKLDVYLEMLRFPFTGIGIYPQWTTTPSGVRIPDPLGFHVDVGSVENLSRGVVQRRWLAYYNDETNEQEYIKANEDGFRQFGILRSAD